MEKAIVELENGLKVEIEIKRYRAQIIQSPSVRGDIIIPKFIEYQSKKYLIINISQDSFRDNQLINSISFPNDSRIRNIDIGAFSGSSISRLLFPASLESLHEMWCYHSNNLCKIEVSPENEYFNYKDDKFLFNRSMDTLLFSRRDISGNIIIPSNIKRIASNAFSQCKKIKSLLFETLLPSNLESIEKYAFYDCNQLVKIQSLPPSIINLGYMCFFSCFFSSLEILGNYVIINDECFNGCSFLNCISLPNAKSITIGINAFAKIKNEISLFVHVNTDIKIVYFH